MEMGLHRSSHAVTVDTASEVTAVNIAATITYDNGYDLNTCKTQIETAIEEYFAGLRKTGKISRNWLCGLRLLMQRSWE